jgi:hypothetical protein
MCSIPPLTPHQPSLVCYAHRAEQAAWHPHAGHLCSSVSITSGSIPTACNDNGSQSSPWNGNGLLVDFQA